MLGATPVSASSYELPNESETLDGVRYDPREDHWFLIVLGMKKHFDFMDLDVRVLSPTLITSFKGVVMVRLRSHPLRSAHTFYSDLRDLLRHITNQYPGASEITMAHLVTYRASLPEVRLWKSTVLHIWIRYWRALGLPGIADDALGYAEEAHRVRNEVGRAVRARCPIHGPYTSLEFDGINKALHASFGRGEVSLYNYGACLLSLALGLRPSQIACLRTSDLTISRDSDGITKYVLAVPRVKQRGRKVRSEFKERQLDPDLGMVLATHIAKVRAEIDAAGGNPEHAAMFPVAFRGQDYMIPGLHTSAENIGRRIAATLEGLDVKSERTGETINSHAYRARRTLGTRMAQEGKPAAVIADALDHVGLENVMVYVEARLEMLARLDEKMSMHLAPLAQRFLGKVSQRGMDRESGVHRHVLGTISAGDAPEDIGGCGKYSFCGLPKPLACYTCIQFRPWDDGPHAAILENLCIRRQKLAETDVRVAETLDDTIVAVAWVVQKCAEKRQSLGSNPNG